MLRALVVLLLLANAVFFVWARGWLGVPPQHSDREPERVLAQVRPELLTVLPPSTASAAVHVPARHDQISAIEAAGAHSHQHLARTGLGIGDLADLLPVPTIHHIE